jgi:hypothetical protein
MLNKYLAHLLEENQRNYVWLADQCGFTPPTAKKLTVSPDWNVKYLYSVADAFNLQPETFINRAKKHCKGE